MRGVQIGLSGRHHLLAHARQRLYLATWLDRYLCKVIGWDLRETMPKALAREVLNQALASGVVRGIELVHGHMIQIGARAIRCGAEHEPPKRLLRQRPCRILLKAAQNRIARRRHLFRLSRKPLEN